MSFESHVIQDARVDVAAVFSAIVTRLPRVIMVTLGLLAIAFVFLMFQPRLYESGASILVEPRSNVYIRATNEQAPSLTGGEAGVVSSQIELVKSRDTLLKVIDQLDLRSVPEFNGSGGGFSPMAIIGSLLGRKSAPTSIDETVLKNLYDRLSVVQERDSRIISVLVRSTNPQLAADIANAIANAHVARRAELSLADTAEASGWLRDEIEKLRVRVTEAETAVANFKVENDLFGGSNNTGLIDQQLSTIAGQINAAQERKNAAMSRAALIRGMMERGQPLDGIADVRDSVVIQQLSEEKARLQGEKAQRSATLLANHPTILALNAQIAELNNQINVEARRVVEALEAEAQVEADLESSLRADLARAKGSASTATQDNVTLESLEREAKAQRDLLEGYLQRYTEAVSRTDSNSALPDVRVVTVAAPSVTPASPNVQLFLIAVGILSVVLQLGLIVFGEIMSGRAIVTAAEPVRPQDELDEAPFSEAEMEDEIVIETEPVVAPMVSVEVNTAAEPAMVDEIVVSTHATPNAASRLVRELAADAVVRPTEPEPEADLPRMRGEGTMTSMRPRQRGKRLGLADLSADVVLGRTHLLILAAHNGHDDAAHLAEELVADALARGLSVALVDAGSGRKGDDKGISDLSLGEASFGDVVQKSADNSFAEVVWGQGSAISPKSGKPFTLVEALGDIYEVVVLLTGRVGRKSSLPLFDGLEGRLVLVAGEDDEPEAVEGSRQWLIEAGYNKVEVAAAPARVAA